VIEYMTDLQNENMTLNKYKWFIIDNGIQTK